jgi:hypothetical protein
VTEGTEHPEGAPADEAEAAELLRLARAVEEEAAAQRRWSSIEAGRRKGGVLGAAAAGAMIGLRDIYEGPPKEDDIVIEIEAAGEPGNIDLDGIVGTVDDVDYWAPPPRDPRIPGS